MSLEENKNIVRAFYSAINARDWTAVANHCHPNFVFYSQIDTPKPGAEGFIGSEKKNFDAFEPFEMRIEHLAAEGEKVMAYIVFEGNQVAPHLGVEPHGKRLRFSLMMMLTVRDGLVIEKRAHYNQADIVRQLSA